MIIDKFKTVIKIFYLHKWSFQEMKEAFVEEAKTSGKERLLLTAAVAAGKDKIDDGYDVKSLGK